MQKWILRVLLLLALSGCNRGHRDDPATNAAVETTARTIRFQTQQWQALHNESKCPTIDQLFKDKLLKPEVSRLDPWNQPYLLLCADAEVTVRSAGGDKQFDTSDDIVVPHGQK